MLRAAALQGRILTACVGTTVFLLLSRYIKGPLEDTIHGKPDTAHYALFNRMLHILIRHPGSTGSHPGLCACLLWCTPFSSVNGALTSINLA